MLNTDHASRAMILASMPDREREIFYMSLTPGEMSALRWDWRFWGRPEQITPPGDWSVWMILAGRGFGKALALDTPLPTPFGWTNMGDVRTGDLLFDETGAVCRVTRAHEVLLGRDCYRVRFSDGCEVVADGEHPWSVLDRYDRRVGRTLRDVSPRTTADLIPRLRHRAGAHGGAGQSNLSVPCAGTLILPHCVLPVDPYVLGYWLGDGTSANGRITTMDEDVVTEFRKLGYHAELSNTKSDSRASSYSNNRISKSGDVGRCLHAELNQLGLIKNKHVPEAYLRSSPEQRLAVLQGLLDSDGTCKRAKGTASFVSTNKKLADAVFELAASLGMKPRCYERDTGSVRRPGGARAKRKFRVGFVAAPGVQLFRIKRKLELQKSDRSKRNCERYIVAIDPVESVPVRCVTVDSPSALYLCGRSMIATHNTRAGSEWVRSEVCGPTPLAPGRASRIALVGETAADVRDVMVNGKAGILACHPPEFRPTYVKGTRSLTWPNGAIALTFSAEDPEQLRGPEHDLAWSDELAKWRYAQETWDMLQFGLRVGYNPRQLVTTTPRPIPIVKEIARSPDSVVTTGSTYDNAANLAPKFIAKMRDRYEGTRLGRQELRAELLEDVPDALWTRSMFERRSDQYPLAVGMRPGERIPDLRRIVVGVDPSGTSGESTGDKDRDEREQTGDDVGIVAAALGVDGVYYVLEDATCQLGPAGWGRRVVDVFNRHRADLIVGERNFGGAMVEYTIRTVDKRVPFKAVHASRGKVVRAEPVAALYEQGRVRHVDSMPQLEDQMCNMTPTGYMGARSPDRLDAVVWAITELAFGRSGESGSASVRGHH